MNEFTIVGTLHEMSDPIAGSSNDRNWTRREFVIQLESGGQWETFAAFTLWNERTQLLDAFQKGARIAVTFSVNARKGMDRWFNDLRVLRVEPAAGQQPMYGQPQQPMGGWYGQPQMQPSGYGQPPAPGAYGQQPFYGQQPPVQGGNGQQPSAPMGYGQQPMYGQQPAPGGYNAPAQGYPPASPQNPQQGAMQGSGAPTAAGPAIPPPPAGPASAPSVPVEEDQASDDLPF